MDLKVENGLLKKEIDKIRSAMIAAENTQISKIQ